MRSDIYGFHSLLTIRTSIRPFISPYPCFIPCTFGPYFIPNMFFLRYFCFAAAGNVGNRELFTVRLLLLSLFMYRITFVLKSGFTLHVWSVFQPQHVFFLCYNCFAATCNVVSHELPTARLILLSLFMYRMTCVLKTDLPATGPIISHHPSIISKPCVLTLLARVYYFLNG